MDQLGGTIEEIAFEKAGIIKPGRPVALYPRKTPPPRRWWRAPAGTGCAPFAGGGPSPRDPLHRPLRRVLCGGRADHRPGIRPHQPGRAASGGKRAPGAGGAFAHCAAGLGAVGGQDRTGVFRRPLPGRLDWAADNLLLDGAHNPQAAPRRSGVPGGIPARPQNVLLTAMMRTSSRRPGRRHGPAGRLRLRHAGGGARALPAEDLAAVYRARGVAAQAVLSPAEALVWARRAARGGVVGACGSLYLVGALMKQTGRPV